MQTAISSPVEPLTIDTHAGGDNQPLNGMLHEGFQEDRCAQRVNPEIFFQLIHALADTHGCSQVKHRRHAVQCLTYRVGMTNIRTDKFNFRMQVRGVLLPHAVYLRGEHIQHAHLVAMREQCISQVRAQKASSSCNEHTFLHSRPLYFSLNPCCTNYCNYTFVA